MRPRVFLKMPSFSVSLASIRAACLLSMLAAFTACGNNDSPFADRTLDADRYAAQCAVPRNGTDLYNGQPYPDRQGSLVD